VQYDTRALHDAVNRFPPTSNGRRSIAAAVATTILVVAPLHLLGALAVLVRDDLGFDTAALGIVFAMFNVGGILASIPGGNLAERLGPRRAMIASGTVTAVAALTIAALVQTWWQLVAAMTLAGVANGMGQPAASLGLARGVRSTRQGLAFGMKQAAVPAAGILAGLSVPLVGLTVGWRWSYAGIALGVLLIASTAPRTPHTVVTASATSARTGTDVPAPPPPSRRTGPSASLIVAFAFGSASATTIPAFLAETAVDAGYSTSAAGIAVAGGSALGLMSRLLAGVLADRRSGGHLRVVALMLAVGTLGSIGLAFASAGPIVFALGTAIAYAIGWGWPGLFLYSIVRLHPERPGAATGRAQAGATIGALLGPLTFGWLVTVTTFRAAWLLVTAIGALAAVLVILSRNRAAREIAAR
jgi:MFS family permease